MTSKKTAKRLMSLTPEQSAAMAPYAQKWIRERGWRTTPIVHANRKPATTLMPACVVAVASEASTNTHTMHPRGPAFWDAHQVRSDEDVMLGVLTVPAGSEVFLSHQEHGGILIGEGTFEVRRQAELGRYVHD